MRINALLLFILVSLPLALTACGKDKPCNHDQFGACHATPVYVSNK